MTRKGALNPKERILNVLPSSKKKKKKLLKIPFILNCRLKKKSKNYLLNKASGNWDHCYPKQANRTGYLQILA